MLEEHINAVLGRYGDDLYAFDVINERGSLDVRLRKSVLSLSTWTVALNDNGTIKASVWSDVLGEAYIETAVSVTRSMQTPHRESCCSLY